MVAVVGLVVDIGVGMTLKNFFGAPLMVAAAVGFLVAALFNYVVNAKTTFADRKIDLSVAGFAAYLGSVLVGLMVRLTALWLMEELLPEEMQYPFAMLVIAAGLSLIANFLLANRWVFRSERPGQR